MRLFYRTRDLFLCKGQLPTGGDFMAVGLVLLNSTFNSCHDSMMKTGSSNLPDLSKFGTPVR